MTLAWNNAMQKTASLQPETPEQKISSVQSLPNHYSKHTIQTTSSLSSASLGLPL